MLLTLEALMNDNKHFPHTLTVAGLSLTEIVDVEEMVVMFLYVLTYDMKNCVIQWEFVRSELPWGVGWDVHKGQVPTTDHPTFKTRYYYLCDAGYPNAEEFLAPYRGQRYNLQEWRGAGNSPTTAKEYFNMKHSSTRNVIQRAFGLLKDRWAMLRDIDNVDEGDSEYATTTAVDDNQYIETTNNMATSSCAPKRVWTKEEEDTLVECLVELVSIGGWKPNNGTFVDVGSNEPADMRGLTCRMETRSFDPCIAKGFTCPRMMYAHHDLLARQTVGPDRANPREKGETIRMEFLRLLREMSNLSSLGKALCQRQVMSRMDDMWSFIEMIDKERKNIFTWHNHGERFPLLFTVLDNESALMEEAIMEGDVKSEGSISNQEVKKLASPYELYVCNLPRSCNIVELVEMFKPYGTILATEYQTTQHHVATNPLYVVPPPVPDIKELEAQVKIQDMGQNENTPAKQKLDVLKERFRAIEGTDIYENIDAT
ncbi:retrotransposon protein [Cucumis melo var. makuwa]|uniref:Retrotransposon protein n=1 Tax=Cucumis melo var. makuwa TaxID=1194695 RepID=A0A5A7UPU1_CUCMM|nr:retrotransposon protein [Cucumis melo var. makuwa]